MGLWERIFGRDEAKARLAPLYEAIVAEGRRREWFEQGGVPDTLNGRFDMLTLVLSFVLIRMEREGPVGREASVRLTELFIDDMDGSVREIGFGDLVVGKQVGRMMSLLGGRLGAYRGTDRRGALLRNLYRGEAPTPQQLTAVEAMVGALEAGIAIVPYDELLKGRLS